MNNEQILPRQNNKLQVITSIDDAAEEIRGILTEAEFNSRWEVISAYYKVGKIIEVLIGTHDISVSEITAGLAVKINRSERALYYSLAMVRKYPDINALPEGKAISWNKLVTKYLTEPKEEKLQPVDKHLLKCPNCGFMFSSEDI